MHACFEQVNKQLEPKHRALDTSVTGKTVRVATFAVRQRTPEVYMAATFCPFCGSRLLGQPKEGKSMPANNLPKGGMVAGATPLRDQTSPGAKKKGPSDKTGAVSKVKPPRGNAIGNLGAFAHPPKKGKKK